jgi:hypothetical protein
MSAGRQDGDKRCTAWHRSPEGGQQTSKPDSKVGRANLLALLRLIGH